MNIVGRTDIFGKFARFVSEASGKPVTFLLAVAIVLVWIITGPMFGYSDTWQLVINTGTTIVTFLMVFVIQHSQNKDTTALQLKIDELIRATNGAHNALIDLEELSEKELKVIRNGYIELAARARRDLRKGKRDDNKPRLVTEESKKRRKKKKR